MNKIQISKVVQAGQLQKGADFGPSEADDDFDYDLQSEQLRMEVYDIIRTIRDPEEPGTLEELQMVSEEFVTVKKNPESGVPTIQIVWAPTNPECKCALTIALCMRSKLFKKLTVQNAKVDILIHEGKHSIKDQIDRQVNDKERVLAAMENEQIVAVITDLIEERPIH